MRHSSRFAVWLFASGVCAALACSGVDPQSLPQPGTLPKVTLLDANGDAHRLARLTDRPWLVFFVHGVGCPIVEHQGRAFEALASAYESQAYFFHLNANSQDTPAMIREDARRLGLALPVLVDERQLLSESLGVDRTTEVFVVATESRRIVWHGPLNDRLDYEAQHAAATREPARDALAALVRGESVSNKADEVKGCAVTLLETRAARPLTYVDDAAPILREHCQSCHRDGGGGPFAMSSYRKVRGWSRMIAEVVRTHRMPPNFVDPEYGHFANDMGLSPEQARTLVHWVEQGAPRGEGDDPLERSAKQWAETSRHTWRLGTPDVVLTLPPYDVPATGVLPYRELTLPFVADHDIWVRAVETRPGDPRVLHHVHIYLRAPNGTEVVLNPLDYLIRYAPGVAVNEFPPGTGKLVRRGSKLTFQMHYTTRGSRTTDATSFAFYFLKQPPERALEVFTVARYDFKIPAHTPRYTVAASRPLTSDSVLYSLAVHMHYRGQGARVSVTPPGGAPQTLLNVPTYSFNWQGEYVLSEPLQLAAGSTVSCDALFDNSRRNPLNPDPAKAVRWGLQVEDEMMMCYLTIAPGAPRASATAEVEQQ